MEDTVKQLKYEVLEDTILVKEFIKKYLSRKFYKYSKNIAAKYYKNGEICYTYSNLNKGDIFELIYYIDEKKNHIGVQKDIEILYEDDDYMIVNKPYNILTIPNHSELDSIFSRVYHYLENTPYTPHILNRLDKETRGLVLIAKHKLASCLAEPNKVYLAKTKYPLKEKEGIISLKMKKDDNSIKRLVVKEGEESVTKYQLKEELNGFYLYDCVLETGKTHQIRLHFSYLGSPLYSDSLYGIYEDMPLGLMCYKMNLINPFTKNSINVELDYHNI